MKAGVLFFIIADVKDYLVAQNLLKNDGTVLFNNIESDAGIAAVIESSLKNYGVDIPEQVDKIVKALPLILGMFL